MITRRRFIRNSALAGSAAMLLPGMLTAQDKKGGIGLQLYTVRDNLEENLIATMQQVAAIGYTYLEAAGYNNGLFYGRSPRDFRQMAEDLGMRVVSSHVAVSEQDLGRIVEAHAALGVEYMVIPYLAAEERRNAGDYRRLASKMNENGIFSRMADIRLGYHNHDFEFLPMEGTCGYDILLQETDPSLVSFEADLYWMYKAGVNPLKYFSKHPGRFELWHVKDMDNTPAKGFTEVGKGILPYIKLFEAMPKIGVKYFFVEQDECETDPLESIKISYKYLEEIVNL
jgi:sugar phosphate isomerase/epimerase